MTAGSGLRAAARRRRRSRGVARRNIGHGEHRHRCHPRSPFSAWSSSSSGSSVGAASSSDVLVGTHEETPVARHATILGWSPRWWPPESGSCRAAAVARGGDRPARVTGEGGDAIGPIMVKLLHDDTAGLAPDFGSYTNVDLDQGIADFVGIGARHVRQRFRSDRAPADRGRDGHRQRQRPFVRLRAVRCQPGCADDPGRPTPPTRGSTIDRLRPSSASTSRSPSTSWTASTGPHPPYSGWGDSRLSCTPSPTTPARPIAFVRSGQSRPDHGERCADVAARQHHGLDGGSSERVCRGQGQAARPAIPRPASTGPIRARPIRGRPGHARRRSSVWIPRPDAPAQSPTQLTWVPSCRSHPTGRVTRWG